MVLGFRWLPFAHAKGGGGSGAVHTSQLVIVAPRFSDSEEPLGPEDFAGEKRTVYGFARAFRALR